MFAVDTAVLLPHTPVAVARVVGCLALLPRWCAGLRRVRYPAPGLTPTPGCVFTYAAVDVRLTLLARTLGPESAGHDHGSLVTHAAEGDGLALTWAFAIEAAARDGGGAARTRLRLRTGVAVEPGHPLAAARAVLCRLVARRAPADLERLCALLDRYEEGRAPARLRRAPPPADGIARL